MTDHLELPPDVRDTMNPIPPMRRSDARHPEFAQYVSSGDKARDVKAAMTRPVHGYGIADDRWWFHFMSQTSGGVNVHLSPYTGTMYVGLVPIRVPEGQRGHGIGTAVMQAVCEVADRRGWILVISRHSIFHYLQEPGLRDWYTRFGFRRKSSNGTQPDPIQRGGLVRMPPSRQRRVGVLPEGAGAVACISCTATGHADGDGSPIVLRHDTGCPNA